ncbi:TPM domain-containing protein [Riemerella anatipestifer]|uniref:TPM domain-containing protein n=1 Tax=Riemerella anatipestifer TaxID=34085 RepID=UPI001BDB4D4C|nr:TPM domain-containing protein [Riemerella anatipestifer]MBT0551325.1 TPM domain-containing protein [Riemerella anatipestifer]MCU7542752.1 TPM domain-containing protein [Riemerella anatipestifer]MCW0513503.1 TPM domain-containing protein [Riemerella anatipestifer]
MVKDYLTEEQQASLVEAIKVAESFSTGEIRVHIDTQSEHHHAKRAFEVFQSLGMQDTKHRNAVLFHINFDNKYLTIIGDEGIHEKVKQDFWNGLHDEITTSFSQGLYYSGLKEAILKTGKELKKYFPIEGQNHNELPDEITFS